MLVLTRTRFRTGDRRLRQPEVLPPYSGLYYAQAFGRSCPQQKFTLPNVVQDDPELTNYVNSVLSQLYQGLVVDDEDCKPSATSPGYVELNQSPRSNHKHCKTFRCFGSFHAPRSRCKYPYLYISTTSKLHRFQWIFGGAFEIGGTSTCVPISRHRQRRSKPVSADMMVRMWSLGQLI